MVKKAFLLLLFSVFFVAPVNAVEANGFTKTTSAIVAVPVGGIFGGVRGAASKSIDYADAFSNELGDGAGAKILGVPSGFVVGLFTGGVSGIINGVVDGFSISMYEPFSDEAFALSGEFTDYDPYAFLN